MIDGLEAEIYHRIKKYMWDVLFAYIDEVLGLDIKENAIGDGVASAIRVGKITYSGGVFKAKTKFSNKLAKELEAMGARYSKAAKGYRLKPDRVPLVIDQAIAEVKIENQEKLKKIQDYLRDIEDSREFLRKPVSFDSPVDRILKNLDLQLRDSLGEINIIPPKMTDFQKAEIAKNYTYNLNYYIQKWTDSEITTMRKDIQDLVLGGYRADALKEFFIKRKGISERKAAFLARQETKLLVAEYRKNRFKQAGVSRYRWSTVLDGRERELHRELNGQIFSWDEPPIIDANTGERGNPSEAYNCRCQAIPVIDDDWWRKARENLQK